MKTGTWGSWKNPSKPQWLGCLATLHDSTFMRDVSSGLATHGVGSGHGLRGADRLSPPGIPAQGCGAREPGLRCGLEIHSRAPHRCVGGGGRQTPEPNACLRRRACARASNDPAASRSRVGSPLRRPASRAPPTERTALCLRAQLRARALLTDRPAAGRVLPEDQNNSSSKKDSNTKEGSILRCRDIMASFLVHS